MKYISMKEAYESVRRNNLDENEEMKRRETEIPTEK